MRLTARNRRPGWNNRLNGPPTLLRFTDAASNVGRGGEGTAVCAERTANDPAAMAVASVRNGLLMKLVYVSKANWLTISQSAVAFSARSITSTSTGAFVDSSLRLSCSCKCGEKRRPVRIDADAVQDKLRLSRR